MSAVVSDALPRYTCQLACTAADVRESQALRYQIFAEEMGAAIDGGRDKLDQDALDPYCEHLLVRDNDGKLVASTRLLTCAGAEKAGSFYSAHEFAMAPIAGLQGRKLEVGRTCVHADYRSGATIAVLWSGLAQYAVEHDIDYLFGCASIPMEDKPEDAYRIMEDIRHRYMSAPDLRVSPSQPLPTREVDYTKTRMPPLLKAYVSLGARACGEPYWDADFNCADVFMLLNLREMHPRYAKRFLGSAIPPR